MKLLKICAVMIAVLAAMRTGSWLLGWILAKFARTRLNVVAILANLVAFAIFVLLLVRDLPGESLDMAALLFGLVVFGVCCWMDLYWRPWRSKG
jgi:hypothetical protein